MNLIDALLGEHAVLYDLFDLLEKTDPSPGRPDPLPGVIVSLSKTLLSHAHLEDELLFPALEARIGPMGPLAVMRAEHEEIEGALGEASRSEDAAGTIALARSAVAVARQHFAKEEQVLFPMARRALGEEELVRLADRWSAMRKVAVR
jgi:hemerythrin-like domain-containing protein